MRWFQLFKAHVFINDALGHVKDLFGKVRDLEERKETDKQEIRDVFETKNREIDDNNKTWRKGQANKIEIEAEELRAAVKSTKSDVGKFLAEQQAVVTEMLRDAEEIRKTVERLLRREAEFTSMIDSRCRGIGEKIHGSIAGDIEKAADRATKAATEAQLVFAQAEASFTSKLTEHKRLVDQKLNLVVETASKAEDLARSASQLKAEALAEVSKALSAARPKSRAERY